MEWIANCIITEIPIIITQILNVIILSRNRVKSIFRTPIDLGKNFIDGKRVFGDNKTWKGLFLSIIICILASIVWGIVCSYIPSIGSRNWFYINNENTVIYNILTGGLTGLAYSIFELPNSFFKRRFGIAPGESSKVKGKKRFIFFIIDQIDSITGIMLVLWYFANLTFVEYLQCVLLGGLLHYVLVITMYYSKLKESI